MRERSAADTPQRQRLPAPSQGAPDADPAVLWDVAPIQPPPASRYRLDVRRAAGDSAISRALADLGDRRPHGGKRVYWLCTSSASRARTHAVLASATKGWEDDLDHPHKCRRAGRGPANDLGDHRPLPRPWTPAMLEEQAARATATSDRSTPDHRSSSASSRTRRTTAASCRDAGDRRAASDRPLVEGSRHRLVTPPSSACHRPPPRSAGQADRARPDVTDGGSDEADLGGCHSRHARPHGDRGPRRRSSFGAVYANDQVYRVSECGECARSDGMHHSRNSRTRRTPLSRRCAIRARLSTGHHGGRWAVYTATGTTGDSSTLVTSWSPFETLASSGQLTLWRSIRRPDFRCRCWATPNRSANRHHHASAAHPAFAGMPATSTPVTSPQPC